MFFSISFYHYCRIHRHLAQNLLIQKPPQPQFQVIYDKQLLATGYVGAPSGFPNCDEVGHQIKKVTHEDGTTTEHCVRTVHAEQNAIIQAAKKGVAIEGATVYCRMTPCRVCAMLIINAGISRVFCERKYHAGTESEQMFRKAKIKLVYKNKEVQKY